MTTVTVTDEAATRFGTCLACNRQISDRGTIPDARVAVADLSPPRGMGAGFRLRFCDRCGWSLAVALIRHYTNLGLTRREPYQRHPRGVTRYRLRLSPRR